MLDVASPRPVVFGSRRFAAGNRSSVFGVQEHDAREAASMGNSMGKRPACMFAVMSMTAMVLLCGCGHGQALAGGGSLPPGVMSAAQACRKVVGRAPRGFFAGTEQVHLVLTTYAKGEPVESQGDISYGMPPQTLVWVVEVHARAINWDHSTPAMAPAGSAPAAPGSEPPPRPDTDYSVVLNARTGYVSDQGECTCWPLPLSQVGTVVSLPPQC
jgi:hypothetical protein